eukprot:1717980-Amphidinium_carterae.1
MRVRHYASLVRWVSHSWRNQGRSQKRKVCAKHWVALRAEIAALKWDLSSCHDRAPPEGIFPHTQLV